MVSGLGRQMTVVSVRSGHEHLPGTPWVWLCSRSPEGRPGQRAALWGRFEPGCLQSPRAGGSRAVRLRGLKRRACPGRRALGCGVLGPEVPGKWLSGWGGRVLDPTRRQCLR